jgi:hypothetical protein
MFRVCGRGGSGIQFGTGAQDRRGALSCAGRRELCVQDDFSMHREPLLLDKCTGTPAPIPRSPHPPFPPPTRLYHLHFQPPSLMSSDTNHAGEFPRRNPMTLLVHCGPLRHGIAPRHEACVGAACPAVQPRQNGGGFFSLQPLTLSMLFLLNEPLSRQQIRPHLELQVCIACRATCGNAMSADPAAPRPATSEFPTLPPLVCLPTGLCRLADGSECRICSRRSPSLPIRSRFARQLPQPAYS